MQIIFERLCFCFETRKFADLRILLLDMEPFDIALFMQENLDEKEQLMFFRLLPKELASDVFVELDSDMQEYMIKAFTDKELKALIDDMFLDDTVDIIEEMPANVVRRIIRYSSPEMRKSINEILNFPDDCAGSIMTIEYVDLRASMKVSEAFAHIRATGWDKETIYTCYVINTDRRLEGVVTVQQMLLCDPDKTIGDIMDMIPNNDEQN